MITTQAWVLHSGSGKQERADLSLEQYSFDSIAQMEVLAEPLFGCWEGNMTHAVSRAPIDVCRQRGEASIVLGNAGVVRILKIGSSVTNVSVGDSCVLVSVDEWDEFGYPMKILAYDAPGTMGVLAKEMKLHSSQVLPIAADSRHTLEQWATFSIRYATAFDNWLVAWGAWKLQMNQGAVRSAFVCAWGGGVGLAELMLAKSHGCRTALIVSDDRRAALCTSLGILPIDRRNFPDLMFDPERFAEDLQFRRRYIKSEAIFLDIIHGLTDGLGVSIFIDNVGAPVYRATRKALARQGVITTCGWKAGENLSVNRASECINRSIHVFTHGARKTTDAFRYAEAHDWIIPTQSDACDWQDIGSFARDCASGTNLDYFPLFRVNPV